MLTEDWKTPFYRWARKLRPILPHGLLANLWQWLLRYAHETDFEIFDWLTEEKGLVLDVGASRGQSALSILRRTRRLHVFSVEPNRKHRWGLSLIRMLHPARFRFRLVAAGNEFADRTLLVPGSRASGLSAQGSLDPAEFEKDYVRERLAESGFNVSDTQAFRRVPVRVVPLDSFGLSPGMVKMDVEGFESQALEGLRHTIAQHRPVLLIENNNFDRWRTYLLTSGYTLYHYEHRQKLLKSYDGQAGVVNLVCIHAGSSSQISHALLKKVSS